MTPPSTPPVYTIKIADFGLARETHSKLPYTTYVSTRWYRAPEVLLRAGEYSAPVDIWAVGAMAVEIATLKPLFPGGNEVDQVWRVCEIMGSPGGWVNKFGQRVGGGEWKDGVRLAQKLGFSFPKVWTITAISHLAILTQCTDGSSLDGYHSPNTTMACKFGYLCHVVSDVGPTQQANIDTGIGFRLFPRRIRSSASQVVVVTAFGT